jgi:hypothetical protein
VIGGEYNKKNRKRNIPSTYKEENGGLSYQASHNCTEPMIHLFDHCSISVELPELASGVDAN